MNHFIFFATPDSDYMRVRIMLL